ncbi:hypothetical protein, partial [Anaerotignum sp.]
NDYGLCVHIHCSVFKDQSAFSAAKIILSNLHFAVKYFSKYFLLNFSSAFSAANDILSGIIHPVKHFFRFLKSFFVLFRCCFVSENQYIICGPACQCFSFQTFAVDLFDMLFLPCQSAATVIYYTRLSKNVNIFFRFFKSSSFIALLL